MFRLFSIIKSGLTLKEYSDAFEKCLSTPIYIEVYPNLEELDRNYVCSEWFKGKLPKEEKCHIFFKKCRATPIRYSLAEPWESGTIDKTYYCKEELKKCLR